MRLRRQLILSAAGLALIGGALAVALSRGGQARSPSTVPVAATAPAGPQQQRYAETRAHGLSLVHMTTVFRTQEGLVVGIVRGNGVTCVVHSDGADHCVTEAEVARGRYLTVSNECTRGSSMGMTIVGLVPPSVRRIDIAYSDRRVLAARVIDGAFDVEARTPQRSDPYPVAVLWLGAHATQLRRGAFPVAPGEYCHPREVPALAP